MSQSSALIFWQENHCACASEALLFTAHLLASTLESPNTINAAKHLHLFLSPNSVSVTLSPRYFSAPLYQSLNLFTYFQQNTGRYNKQTRMMDATYWLRYIQNEIWWVNAELTSNLKYLHARHTIHKGKKHKPTQTWLTSRVHHFSLLSVYEHYAWVPVGIHPPPPPSSIIWFITMMMKHNCIRGTNYS